LAINALGVTAAINVVVNLAIAWLGTRGAKEVPLWSTPLLRTSTIADTVGTTFMLPFITALTCGAAVNREIRRGKVSRLPDECSARRLFNALPRSTVARAFALASLALAAIGPIALITLTALRFGNVNVPSFVLFKVGYAVGLGLLITPVIALAAMAQEAPAIRPEAA
jgi:hypothetical protein